MRKEVIYSLKSPYREEMKVQAYHFGKEDKSVCIVGAIRGNEVQQMYVCSQLVAKLTELEERGAIVGTHGITVIPAVNYYAMNIGKRFWSSDNTDINRMFPGYNLGETTQRIASGLFEAVKDYNYGIQLASFYLPGDFTPHVRMMDTGYQSTSLANLFGLPYVVVRKPSPIDTTTLNYNWQVWETNAFSVYTKETDEIDEESARIAVSAILRFMSRMGVIRINTHGGYISTIIKEEELLAIHSNQGGIYRRYVEAGQAVYSGQLLADILHPYEGEVVNQVYAPCDGVVFFAHRKPLVNENEIIYRIIKGLHE